jgi:D-alanyl-D-alanine carboxypeptidase
MHDCDAARRSTLRLARTVVIGLIVVAASIIGTLGHQSASSSASSFISGRAPGTDAAEAPATPSAAPSVDGAPPRAPGRATRSGGPVSEEDGALPHGVTVFDDEHPGVTRLDPALLDALRAAARDAAGDGIELDVNSGWRSAAYQAQLLREAIETYGSAKEAARWVATAEASPHVSGDAVDIGPAAAAAWLSRHGAAYGLCRVYDNEPWHLELRPAAVDRGCPPTYADPTQDPRMGA